MEANKILTADVLDIIFEGRNKAYGAYNLRKTYDRRLIKAMAMTIASIALIVGGYVLAGSVSHTKPVELVSDPIELTPIPETDKVEPPPPVIPKPQPPRVEMVRFTPPLIVHDELVPPTEMPPANEDLTDTKIGPLNQSGIKDDGVDQGPVEAIEKGIVTAPAAPAREEEIFTKVEIESQYPGGAGAWMRYLNKMFRYPEEAQTNEKQGTVEVQFIVDQDGNVSNVEAISGPESGGLREEAIRVIRKSGKWEPAQQNGRKVKSYKKQPIIFRLNVE